MGDGAPHFQLSGPLSRFLQSSFWAWELAPISLTSLHFVWPAENPSDPVCFRQKSTTSILWLEAGYEGSYKAQYSSHNSVVYSRVASAELRRPGLTLLLATMAKVHMVTLARVVSSRMTAEVALLKRCTPSVSLSSVSVVQSLPRLLIFQTVLVILYVLHFQSWIKQ